MMIKYLGLFAIICTIGISSLGVIDVDASITTERENWEICMMFNDSNSIFSDLYCGPYPYDSNFPTCTSVIITVDLHAVCTIGWFR